MALFQKCYENAEYNENIEELIDVSKDIEALDWEDVYWLAKCIQSADSEIDTDEIVMKLINYAFNHGLNYSINPEKYFDAAKILSRLYLRRRDYVRATNYLMDISERSEEVPDWVNIYYLLSQVMTDNIYRIAEDPYFFFKRLNSISEESFKSRAKVYRVFLDRLHEIETKGTTRELNIASFEEQTGEYIGEYLPGRAVSEADDEDTNEEVVSQEKALKDLEDAKEQAENEKKVLELRLDALEKSYKEKFDALIAERDALSKAGISKAELEDALKKKDQELEVKNNQLREQEELLGAKDKEIKEKEKQIKDREAALVQARLFAQAESIDADGDDSYPLLKRNEVILVLGAIAAKKNELVAIAKKEYGLLEDNFEFMDDFGKMTNFKVSSKHRAVICGPMPHKMEDTDGFSSLITRLENDEDRYVVRCEAGANGLKITKTSFRGALQKAVDYLSIIS